VFSVFSTECLSLENIQNEEFIHGTASICEPKKFNRFLETFSTSIAAQKKYTRFPVEKLYVDAQADPEPSPRVIELEESQIDFPIYPNPDEIRAGKLSIEVSASGTETKVVRLYKPETDYVTLYFFEYGDCWNLVRIEDWSLNGGASIENSQNARFGDPCSAISDTRELDPWKRFFNYFPIYQGGVLWFTDVRLSEDAFEGIFSEYGVVGYKIVNCGSSGGFVWVPRITGDNCIVYKKVRNLITDNSEKPMQLLVQYEFGFNRPR
jgi:hypothetical protein